MLSVMRQEGTHALREAVAGSSASSCHTVSPAVRLAVGTLRRRLEAPDQCIDKISMFAGTHDRMILTTCMHVTCLLGACMHALTSAHMAMPAMPPHVMAPAESCRMLPRLGDRGSSVGGGRPGSCRRSACRAQQVVPVDLSTCSGPPSLCTHLSGRVFPPRASYMTKNALFPIVSRVSVPLRPRKTPRAPSVFMRC